MFMKDFLKTFTEGKGGLNSRRLTYESTNDLIECLTPLYLYCAYRVLIPSK